MHMCGKKTTKKKHHIVNNYKEFLVGGRSEGGGDCQWEGLLLDVECFQFKFGVKIMLVQDSDPIPIYTVDCIPCMY